MNMADAIAELETGTYTVKRFGPSVFVNGRLQAQTPTTLYARGVLVPLTPLELKRLPDGARNGEALNLYTSVELRSAQAGGEPDVVTVNGTDFSVERCARWDQAGNYFVATLVALP